MSGYTPIKISFGSPTREADYNALWNYWVEEFGVMPGLDDCIAKLIFDQNGQKWLDTIAVSNGGDTLSEVLVLHNNIRIDTQFKIGQHKFFTEVYLFKKYFLEIKLPSKAYEAIFGFSPRLSGQINKKAKQELLRLIFGTASFIRPSGFMLQFDDGEIEGIKVDQIQKLLLSPELKISGKRPGLLTGIDTSLIQRKDLEVLWGKKHVCETVSGYTILDLLQPIALDKF